MGGKAVFHCELQLTAVSHAIGETDCNLQHL